MSNDSQRVLAFNLVLGLVLELMIYGAYFVTFLMSMYFLVQKQHARHAPVNKVIALVGILLFCVITAQTVIMTITLFTPFAAKYASQDPSVTMTNANESYLPMNVAMLALYFSELFISNFLMIYRVWIVFQRNWAMVTIPLLSLIVSIVAEGFFIRQSDQQFEQDFGGVNWIIIALSFDVFINVYCTGLLAQKIWRSQQLRNHATVYVRSFSSFNVVAIIIESAALYTCTTVVLLVTFSVGVYGSYTIRTVHCVVPGISYCLVIIRFGIGGAFKTSPELSTLAIPPSANSGSQRENDIAMQPVAVNIHLEHKTEASAITSPSFIDLEAKERRGETD